MTCPDGDLRPCPGGLGVSHDGGMADSTGLGSSRPDAVGGLATLADPVGLAVGYTPVRAAPPMT